MEDRRRFERFPLELPVRIDWVDPGQNRETLALVTKDVSAGGAFIPTKEEIPTGTRVQLRLVVTSKKLKELSCAQALVRVKGTVIRRDPTGIAICFDEDYDLTSLRIV